MSRRDIISSLQLRREVHRVLQYGRVYVHDVIYNHLPVFQRHDRILEEFLISLNVLSFTREFLILLNIPSLTSLRRTFATATKACCGHGNIQSTVVLLIKPG